MQRVIRENIWETNSSSMHTLTIQGKGKWDFNNDASVILVQLDEYGWHGDPCDDFMSKLAYALSMVLHTEYPGFDYWDDDFTVDQNKLEECDGYQTILSAINMNATTWCEKIIIRRDNHAYYPYGYIDHQSCENYNSLQDFLDDWNIDIERFLFDNNVIVWIDNDN